MESESRIAVTAALLGNLALALLKAVAAAFTGSASMLAETFHSLADTGNQVLLFVGMRLGQRPPDERHRFGHGKDVYFWAFVVSIMLFSLGGAFSIWEGVRHFLHPSERSSLSWAYGVLAGSLVFEAVSLAVALRSLWRTKGQRTVGQYWRDTRDPTIVTVVCEDTAALVSLLIAGAGIGIAQWTGNTLWDAGASALIGLILVGVAVFLAFENYSLLLGESAPPHVVRQIRQAIESAPGVRALRDLRTMHLGPRAVLVVASVEFDPSLDGVTLPAAAASVRARVGEVLRGITNPRLIVVEPALDVRARRVA